MFSLASRVIVRFVPLVHSAVNGHPWERSQYKLPKWDIILCYYI